MMPDTSPDQERYMLDDQPERQISSDTQQDTRQTDEPPPPQNLFGLPKVVDIRDNRGLIAIGDHISQTLNQVSQNIINIPLWMKWMASFVLMIGMVTLGLTSGLYPLIHQLIPNPLDPMAAGTWNIAVASFAVEDEGVLDCDHEQSRALSNRIFSLLQDEYGEGQARLVPCITGDVGERSDRAAEYAQTLGASVIVYGVIRLNEPIGKATFIPEIYVHPVENDGIWYTGEILGQTTFGSPVRFIPSTTRGPENEEINQRLIALRHFVEGIRRYIVDDFEGARGELQAALTELEASDDSTPVDTSVLEENHTRAVVHQFLGAVYLGQGLWYEIEQDKPEKAYEYYIMAMKEVQRAHDLWPSYARPFLAQGSVVFSLARLHRPDGPRPAAVDHLPLDIPIQCFDGDINNTTTFQQMLRISRQCFIESPKQNSQTEEMAIANKVRYTQANILVLWSAYSDETYWQEAWQHLNDFVDHYESTSTPDQLRQRRLAAHAYARRGLIQAYYLSDRECQYRRKLAAEDYELAVALLVEPFPGVSCAENLDGCLEGDRRYIDIYDQELGRLTEEIVPAGSTLTSCHEE